MRSGRMMKASRFPWRMAALFVLAAIYGAAGVLHLLFPDPFIAVTPGWVPQAELVIRITGICELLGAVGLVIPRTRKLAGFMLALYAVCVFPANIKHAFWMGEGASMWRWAYHGPRLLLQPVIIWWALWASAVIDWPFGRSAVGFARGRIGEGFTAVGANRTGRRFRR